MDSGHPEGMTTPTPDPRWEKVERVLDEALRIGHGERAAWLTAACGSDGELRQEVESLLAYEGRAEWLAPGAVWEGIVPADAAEAGQPAFSAGTLVGPYRILSLTGKGGMGEVYSAEDTRLGRKVAVKFLPARLMNSAGALERFRREAQAVSSLNHPNICTLYDVGSHQGQPYLVMELLEGSSLRQKLEDGPLPLPEILSIGIQACHALEAAHAQNIIHRDIKPANLFLTPPGTVKMLDFGLVKLRSDGASEPEATSLTTAGSTEGTITVAGRAMGTASYMSPEQARGEDVDGRSDLFSLGVVLYHIATGSRPFYGETPASTVTAILNEEPLPPVKRNPAVPDQLGKIILKALEKDKAVRYQRASELRADLEALQTSKRPVRWRFAAALMLGAILAVAGARFGWFGASKPTAPPVLTRLTFDSGFTTDPALSPDGKLLAFASDRSGEGNLDIYVQQIGGGKPIRLTRGSVQSTRPIFSPDGTTIAFRSGRDGGGVYVVPTVGGAARMIIPGGLGPQFSPDGRWIAYYVGGNVASHGSSKIYVVPCAEGKPRQVRADFAAAAFPIWLTNERLLFLGNRDTKLPPEEAVDWWVTPIELGPAIKTGALAITRKEGLEGSMILYPWTLVPSSWLPASDAVVFSARSRGNTNLWRLRISSGTSQAAGVPQRLTSGLTLEEQPSAASGLGGVSRVVFTSVSENIDIWSVPLDPQPGRVTGEPQSLGTAAGDYHSALSADGARMVFISSRTGNEEIWIRDLRTGQESLLTASRSNKYRPFFSPDGSKVSFSTDDPWNIYVVPSTGGTPELICMGCGALNSWLSDGKRALGNSVDGRIFLLELRTGRRTCLLVRPGSHVCDARISPDGHWIAFLTSTGGYWQVWVAPFETHGNIAESAWIPIANASFCEWSSDGDAIYFPTDRDGFRCIWAQRLEPGTKRPKGEPIPVFHVHSSRRVLGDGEFRKFSIGADKLVFNMGERTSNIWMAEWKER